MERNEEKTKMSVLRALAISQPLTIPKIARRTQKGNSTIHEIIKGAEGLEKAGIAKAVIEEPYRTGLPRRFYALTFIGLLRYLSLIYLSKTRRTPEAEEATGEWEQNKEKILAGYGELYNYPIFSERKAFEAWIGEVYYDLILKSGHANSTHYTKEFEGFDTVWLSEPEALHRFTATFVAQLPKWAPGGRRRPPAENRRLEEYLLKYQERRTKEVKWWKAELDRHLEAVSRIRKLFAGSKSERKPRSV